LVVDGAVFAVAGVYARFGDARRHLEESFSLREKVAAAG